MNYRSPRVLALFTLTVAGIISIPVRAQSTSPARSDQASANAAIPSSAQVTSKAEDDKADDQPVVLSPFSVFGESNSGYQAHTTLATALIRTDVGDVGDGLQIVTQQFLKDTGATDAQTLLTYTTGTEVGGVYGNFEGNGNGATVYEQFGTLARPDLNTRIRGLSSADNTRDYEGSDIPWDAYNIDTVEIQRGANSILFGLGSPSGLINASLKQADFKEGGEYVNRFGSYSSNRNSLDFNHVLLKDELSFRIDLLNDHEHYEESPAFNNDKRVFGALRYDPKFLNKGSAHTSLRVSYESGAISADNPRTLPPVDEITPWFKTGTTTVNGVTHNNLNQGLYNYNYADLYFANVANSGPLVPGTPNYQPSLAGLYQGSYAYFPNPSSSTEGGSFYAPAMYYMGQQYGLAPDGSTDKTIGGLVQNGLLTIAPTQTAALQANLPFASSYKQASLTNTNIFDFYHNLVTGPNGSQLQNFQALNAVLTQTFFDGRMGFAAEYDRERYSSEDYDPYYGSSLAISVDVNSVLQDGTPNPNAGRPYIVTQSYYGGTATETLRQDSRLTGFIELRSDDFFKKSWLTRILGRQIFTGLLNYTSDNHDAQAFAANAFAPLGSTSDPDGIVGTTLDPYRWFQQISYLGPNLSGKSLAGSLQISGLTAVQQPATTNNLVVFNSKWNQPGVSPGAPWYNPLLQTASTQSENPANYVGWSSLPVNTLESKSDRDQLTTSANQNLDTVASKVLVWQGYFLDGDVVPTIGYRRDTAKSYTVGAPTTSQGVVDQSAASYNLPSSPFNTISGTTKSFSVVAHTPNFIKKYFPKSLGLDFSLFIDSSENFEPSSGRVDILANPISAPTGRTKDFGAVISAFNDRLSLKVTRYKSQANGASYSGITYEWLAGDLITRDWVWAKRFQAGLTGNPVYAGPNYNYGSTVNGVFSQTAADKAEQQADVTAVLGSSFINNPAFWSAWNMPITSNAGESDTRWMQNDYEPWSGGLGGIYPTNMTATSDNVSTGIEFELYCRPTDSWDITLNVAKQNAVETNIAGGSTLAFLTEEQATFSGAAGQIRSNGADPTSTIQSSLWNPYLWNPLVLSQLLNGTDDAELRPWRANFVTNYRFTHGLLKGVNIGGGYQWQDKVAIGYPSIYANINGQQLPSFDVKHPYYGPTDTTTNLWVGYQRKIARNLMWHIQLNVNNALGHNELIPINTQPDGTPAAYRIKDGPEWSLTNRFTF